MSKRIVNLLALLFLGAITLNAQNYRDRIYASYISGDMHDWALVIQEMKRANEQTNSIDLLYELSMAQYGYIGFSIIKDNRKDARTVLHDVEQNIKVLLNYEENWPEVHALLGALYGLKVGVDPYKALFFVRKALTYNETALKVGPENSQVWMEKGNLEFYKPGVFGKDIPGAIKAYKKSLLLFEKEPTDKNWLYLNTMISLAGAYTEAGLIKEADIIYKKILRQEPNITWVRDKEYPRFQRKYLPLSQSFSHPIYTTNIPYLCSKY